MSDTGSITGKVAAIVDATTLVLNVGGDQGVKEGMVFAVVAAQQEIVDPDSGASLGAWEVVKARVVITHVQERLSTARPPHSAEVQASGTLSEMMVRHSFGLYGDRTGAGDRPALDVVTGTVSGRPRVAPIAVGDSVRSISLDLLAAASPATPPEGSQGDLPSQAYGSPTPPDEPGASAEESSGDTGAPS